MTGNGRPSPGAGHTPANPAGGSRLLSVAWKAVAGLALAGAAVLVVGGVLPGTWETERSIRIDAPTDSVYRWIDAPARWTEWTVWGSVETTAEGPERGEGAARSWDDDYVGDGRFVIAMSAPPDSLRYRVEVEGGQMRTWGLFRLEPVDGATRVVWAEAGDFGWNPLMGFAARSMDRIQGTELARGLRRLKALVETGSLPDSLALPEARSGAPRPVGDGADG